MTDKQIEKFRRLLEATDLRLRGDMKGLEEAVRLDSGESGAPTHQDDMGSEHYLQELNTMLFENEDYIRTEVGEALGRIAGGTFGTCERCGTEIMEERLEVLPYTRYCTPCSAEVGDGAGLGKSIGERAGRAIAEDGEGFEE